MEARGGASSGCRGAARGWVAAALACCALAIAPVAASAASLAITTGPDPVESITTQVGLRGALETSDQRIVLKVKPSGGSACGLNPTADDGSQAINSFPGLGAYTETQNWTFDEAGSYLLCGWITDSSRSGEPVLTSASQTLAVRVPHLSLSIGAPATVLRGRTFQVTETAQAETERDVRVIMVNDTGRGCPANSDAAYSTSGELGLVYTSVTGGPVSQTANVRLNATGRYLVCGYVNYGERVSPEATAVASILVVAPCIVPHLGRGTLLRRAKARIVAAHCTVGRIRYAASARRRGTVIALSPGPGTGHATHAPVQVTVSSGPPRRRRHR